MDIAKLVAVGLGFVIYLGGSIFARRLRRRRKARAKDEVTSPAREKPKAADTASVEPVEVVEPVAAAKPVEAVEPVKAVEPIERPAGTDLTGTSAMEEEAPLATEAPKAKAKERPAAKPKAPSKARPSSSGAPAMAWFVIKSKTGSVRVVQARGKTPKTVAGPYPTKEEASKARELTLARASVSSGRTRPKGKAGRARK